MEILEKVGSPYIRNTVKWLIISAWSMSNIYLNYFLMFVVCGKLINVKSNFKLFIYLILPNARFCVTPVFPPNPRHWSDVVLMLGHRRRRWPNIKPTLAQCLMFCWVVVWSSSGWWTNKSIRWTLWCRYNVYPPSTTLALQCTNTGSMDHHRPVDMR